jgi:hypothetical protein
VLKVCEAALLVAHRDRFHAESRRLLEERQQDDLMLMHRLLSRTQRGLDPMLVSFRETVVTVGLAAIKNAGDAVAKVVCTRRAARRAARRH